MVNSGQSVHTLEVWAAELSMSCRGAVGRPANPKGRPHL